jgi:mRNA interferase MazF
MVMTQYDIFLINLDPTVGHEMRKVRPCIIISPDEMNRHIGTVIVAPMTTKSHEYPSRHKIVFQDKTGWIVLDQIRTIDKRRLVKRLGHLDDDDAAAVKNIINEMLVK